MTNLMPTMYPYRRYDSNLVLMVSTMITYKRGDRGKPFLGPLVNWKKALGLSLTKGATDALLI